MGEAYRRGLLQPPSAEAALAAAGVVKVPGRFIESTNTNTPLKGGATGASKKPHRPLLTKEKIRPISLSTYTILAQHAPYWSNGHTRLRRLSAVECAIIQTFPRDFRFNGLSAAQAQRVIGNAVPPLIAREIAAASRR